MSTDRTGVIHDIGYQRYAGARLGRGYAARSLYAHGLGTAFGLGRSAKSKIFPWFVASVVLLIAVVVTAIRALGDGEPVMSYVAFSDVVSLLTMLFCVVVGPELFSRDLRSGVLPLYFSRPLARADYALAKWAALVSAAWLLLAAPLLVMFLGGAFGGGGLSGFWDEVKDFVPGLLYAGVNATLVASIAALISSLSGRRAISAAMTAAFFLLSSAVVGIVTATAVATEKKALEQLSFLFSPQTLSQGIELWVFPHEPDRFGDYTVGPYGPVYGLAWLVAVAGSVLLLLVRYRKVAR